MTIVKAKPEVQPVTGSPTKLLIHIIKRKSNGQLGDKTLCGKLWDHPVQTAKDICEECQEIAKRDGHDWKA